ncbi:hypothetical protein PGUG_02500 [Meyerozyma guilliermondii ATCC 6260]|uniref:N(6)-L-threonylcarbamoyladenine synthase n=1 Tax=Meyerozyma guilliermondii (strain ATCC 6260 / CBS 566 / DSM 6381 / JCM 1539 / NBRC 10279 / NRRL Y-324) TaxID=294746 RepID=A5DGU9_PICGU|nr:uncharacterized protein PGUG_02500 [Meyerozyma guilliermondii ATCC 6260]EDK38402.2 hypothetical protein PGUG_02500 [Meyerozyma guilliermondii ATCC 6260]
MGMLKVMLWRSNGAVGRVFRRRYRVLAIESSCDDACIALLDRKDGKTTVIDQVKSTLNSVAAGGVIPTEAHGFHQYQIASQASQFFQKHKISSQNSPDLICCTRGPGMVGSLSAGLQFAKGLSVAWDKPLVGVHHMLGHLMIASLTSESQTNPPPRFPFLSLLCSGGHTMLVLSESLAKHQVLVNTVDIACGDALDKCARKLGLKGNMLGKELETFVNSFSKEELDEFTKIKTHTRDNPFNFQLKLPMRSPKHPRNAESVQFSFASFLSTLDAYSPPPGMEKSKVTKFLAFKVQQKIFEHIVDRIKLAVDKNETLFANVNDIVLSGGVASNSTLRRMLKDGLNDKMKRPNLNFHFPEIALCTDNAIMIGVAGIEIYENLNVVSDLSITPIRKWPLDQLLDVDGWTSRS